MQQLHETLKEYFEQIRFARAAELARSRRYLEAEGLLSPTGRELLSVKELDLLARISAQQRQYERARHFWESALQQEPENGDYKRAIECTREAERFDSIFRKAVMTGLGFVTSILLAILGYLYLRTGSPSRMEHRGAGVYGNRATQPAAPVKLPDAP